MIKVIALDLVGVLVREKDIELTKIEDKLEENLIDKQILYFQILVIIINIINGVQVYIRVNKIKLGTYNQEQTYNLYQSNNF